MTNIKDIYFGFYDQLTEPERSQAKENYKEKTTSPICLGEAINSGFIWEDSPQGDGYWRKIRHLIKSDNYEFNTSPKKTYFKDITSAICELLEEKDKRYGSTFENPLEIFEGKCKVGKRIDEKLSRIKNSPELRLNDVADTIGYIILAMKEKGWNKEDILKLID